MKNSASWWDAAVRDFEVQAAVYGDLPMPARRLLEMELVFTLLIDYLPDQDPRLAWAVLNGLSFPGLERLPYEARRAVEITRLWLSETLSRSAWQRNLRHYENLQSPFSLYRVKIG